MHVNTSWRAAAAALMLGAGVMSACGGSSSPSPAPLPPPAANRPPVITSPASASINENTTGTVYTLTANDPDGDPVTLSIVAGGDEGVFTFDPATGILSLGTPLDFENPQDADRNNIYLITFEARDNRGGMTRITVEIRVLNVAEGMALRRVGSGFSQPLYLSGIPGTEQVVVLQKGGRARVLNPESGAIDSVDFLNVASEVSTDSERGLLGLAFSPGFESDRLIYVNLTNLAGDTEIRRYQMFSGSSLQADPSTLQVLLTIPQPRANHNAGWLGFGGDGLLYIPTGDSGGGGDPDNVAQNPDSLLGKVLRIDVSGDDFPSDPALNYRIPTGNAFPGGAGGAPEIFALGLRNPYRASFDPVSGDLFIGDVGQSAVEEINRMRLSDSGANYGWRLREGTLPYNGGANSPSFTPPVTEYFHGTGPNQGRSVTGGYVYRGPIEPIRDHYVFGDFISGNVWSVPEASLVPGQTLSSSNFNRLNDQLVPNEGTLNQVSSFGLDTEGRLYIVSFGGSVFRVEPAP
ncbi:PQQ-dependent sugar dehydrogenase [Hyphomonas sp.]|uniref:PQQ-dependent sugar dehydrogenase n=1 Tax=Hyphomonas sp. TaxID=87 RepID=UPI00391B0619